MSTTVALEGDLLPTEGLAYLPPVPDQGQVVEVRGSTWAVADVREQGLPRSPADESHPRAHHVVTLQSLAEDRLGDELTVVWELEVGHTVAPDQGLPETIGRFDDPNTLAAFVNAVRWGAVTSADANAYQAPFRSGANVEAYQLEPLRRALQAPRTNLLLADDVGLGKTIEAGLVIQELLLRHRARSVVVVCPPSLALKWQDEMREKFGLEFVIVNRELMAAVRRSHGLDANPFRLFPRVIVSMAWLPTPRAQRLLRAVYGQVGQPNNARRFAFDVLVVDEAHHVAPASPTAPGRSHGYAVDSQRTVAMRELAQRCEHRLFLSATPHNGHSESFTALLEMIDGRRFSRGAMLDTKALQEVIVRRLKTELPDKDFQPRSIKRLPFTPTEDEQQAFQRLDNLLTASARRNGRKRGGDIVSMLLKKRFLSSPWAFAQTMSLYDEAVARGGTFDLEDDPYAELLGSDSSDEEEGQADHPEFMALRHSKRSDPLVAASPADITALTDWGDRYQNRPDSRLQELITFLDGICRPTKKTWSNERVVIFTEYTSTLEWIVRVLEQKGYGPVLDSIRGSTPVEDRETTRARFSEDPAKEPIRVLVATDSAGEGIDMQAHCHRLVNFDIPFNPSRLEQRIGRIDRYGQTQPPEIFHLVSVASSTTYADDLAFMGRIAEKVGTIAADLGSVNQVIDADIQRHFARSGAPAPVLESRSDGTNVVNQTLAGGIELNRRLTELSRTYAERKGALHLTPGNARRVVDTALRLTAQPVLVEVGDDRTDAEVFEVPAVGSSWQSALRGLDTRLRPGQWRPITFDDRAAASRTDLVNIHLGHALLQKAARILRSALFSTDADVSRVTAVVVDNLPQSCVAAVSRLVLVGRGGIRLHEEVFLTGIRLRGRAMAEAKVERLLEDVLDHTDLRLANRRVRTALTKAWNAPDSRLRSRLLAAMTRRAEEHQHQVTDRLLDRQEADATRAREIFAAFRRNLTESLAQIREAEAAQETMLFGDDQHAQRRRDIRAMEERLASLTTEERREIAGIEERYADIRPHVTAAAVVFALSAADVKSGKIG
jgi:superfamily II DNA or RNA helicase